MLDLGCGPGIYAELFDDAGYHVTGIVPSTMLGNQQHKKASR
ncbi:class I SAM-dependent methyltransferase [[Brevibacterium] frigoritolerans]|nr:class I SAM-dependent methyltransferase [Peribacillus frigoritolerans]